MSRGATVRPDVTDDHALAQARQRFLTAEPVEPDQVRDTILASWWRSLRSNVAADRIDLSYVRDPDLDTPLIRSAAPVLKSLRENLDGQPISVILTDPGGVVLSRLTADRDLERYLDRVQLAPGFSYAEEFVGTNGIGTALEGGRPTHVFGHEHYAEHLETLACAGVPIRHPISGKTIGAVDLTCWRKDADALLIALAKTAADQITQAVLASTGAPEYELLEEYLRACRRTAGIVLALNSDTVMMNDYARHVLDPGDQVALLGSAGDALAADRLGPVDVELPSGARARMYCRPMRGSGQRRGGGVVHVRMIELVNRQASDTGPLPRKFLPGLVGSGRLWLRGCQQVEAAYVARDWLALEGEPGVGKLALLRAMHRSHDPPAGFMCLMRLTSATPTGCARYAPSWPRGQAAWSSGTLTGSVPGGCTPCGPRWNRRWPRPGSKSSGSRSRSPRTRPAKTWPGCCSSSRAPWNCRRCATTSRTCPNSCSSSWPSSITTVRSAAQPRRCSCCCGPAGRVTPNSCGR